MVKISYHDFYLLILYHGSVESNTDVLEKNVKFIGEAVARYVFNLSSVVINYTKINK